MDLYLSKAGILGLIVFVVGLCGPTSADVVINEFMAVNSNGIEDEDGDRSDWIELYNTGNDSVNLSGWFLTDNENDLTKWEFSPVVVGPGAYRLIWASNKNRKDPDEEIHTNFRLSGGGEYLALVKPDGVTIASEYTPSFPEQIDDVSYGLPSSASTDLLVVATNSPCTVFVPTSDALGLTWTESGFDDGTWPAGLTGIGYDTAPDYLPFINLNVQAVMYNQHPTIYSRIPFVVPEGVTINSALLRLRYDDGFRAYINGQPIASGNISGDYSWDEDAPTWLESNDYVDFVLSSVGPLQTGTNVLAIHGVNDRANSSDFLLLPELTLTVSASPTNQAAVYFIVPTPGSANIGGAANVGPRYAKVTHVPEEPLANESLNVSVEVLDDDGVAFVSMTYEVMFGGETTVAMFDDGLHGDGAAGDSVYGASIPSSLYASGEMIRYRFNATDGSGNSTAWPLYHDPLNSPRFFGTMAQVVVPSNMPVMHWFIENTANADTVNESRSSIFYDGRLYDNIMTRTRGGSTENSSVIKKSHKFDFNRADHFEYDPNERKVEEMNLNTTYSDKTYLRRILAWSSHREMGGPGCNAFLVHLRRNNAFYGIQTFEEQVDSDYLIRNNHDPEGALYKVIGFDDDDPVTGHRVHRVSQKSRHWDSDTSDIEALVHGVQEPDRESFIFDNMDVSGVINYVALTTLFYDRDVAAKNHYLYRDSDGSGDWSVFPWDKDLTFGKTWDSVLKVLDDTITPFPDRDLIHPNWGLLHDAVWNSPDLQALYLRRFRSIADQILQPASTPLNQRFLESLIDEQLQAHGADLMLDYNTWGNPWSFGTFDFYDPGQANTNSTIDVFLSSSRSVIYARPELPPAQAASPAIQISQVEVTPVSGNQAEEFIELFNPNAVAVDISGWTLSNAVSHVFRSGSVILPGGTFYVSPDTRAFRNRAVSPKGGENRFVQGSYKGMLSSRGETLALYDADGLLKDTETWAENLSDAQRHLRVSEVMYNPAVPNGSGFTEDRLEYVELINIGPTNLNIGGTFFSSGLVYTNPSVVLAPGGHVVIASDPVALSTLVDTNTITVLGPFSGYLANGNDEIELEDHRGETVQRFEYNDDWYPQTDGEGFSLTVIDPANTNLASWSEKDAWRPSLNLEGSPGAADSDLSPGDLVINEVLAHSDTGGDWIELINLTSSPISIGNWFVSDDPGDLKKYQIPGGTTLPANGFAVLLEAAFNSGPNAFALSELGDEVVLNRALPDGTLQGFQTSRDFDASGKDVSLGRWIDSEGDRQFIPMTTQTPGAANSAPKTDPVLISEIMYRPASNQAEYIELYNRSGSDQQLYDPESPTNMWFISGAVDFTFPAGQVLPSGSFALITSTNEAAFRLQYAVPAGVNVYGPFSGSLNNAGERVRLNYPGNPEPAFVPQIQLESVNYKPDAPWPVTSEGSSIERISATAPANDPVSWSASAGLPSPGESVLNGSGNLQLSSLWKELHFGTNTLETGMLDDFDLDGRNNLSEFVTGSDPTNGLLDPVVELTLLPNGNFEVSIPTLVTDPTLYFGLTRCYSFEQRPDLSSGVWTPVPGAEDVPASGSLFSFETSSTNVVDHLRAVIELK